MAQTTAYISTGDVTKSVADVSIFQWRQNFSVTYHPVTSWLPFCQQWWRQHWFVTAVISLTSCPMTWHPMMAQTV